MSLLPIVDLYKNGSAVPFPGSSSLNRPMNERFGDGWPSVDGMPGRGAPWPEPFKSVPGELLAVN